MKKLSLDNFRKLRRLVYRGARPLEFTMWKCVLENGNHEDFLSVISAYQNEDGGFGHNIEANLWNPNSSPEITSYTLNQIKRAGCDFTDKNHPIVNGVLKYLASGEYLTESGWLCGLPSNLDYSHAPWFGYDLQNEIYRILDPLVDFILKYADSNSEIYQKAILLKEKHEPDEQPAAPDFSNYDPTKYEPWGLLPTNYVNSPDSEYYLIYKEFVDMELDGIVDRLHNTNEIPVMSFKDAGEDVRQIIGNYYWAASDYISQIEKLKKFNRLDFSLPVM